MWKAEIAVWISAVAASCLRNIHLLNMFDCMKAGEDLRKRFNAAVEHRRTFLPLHTQYAAAEMVWVELYKYDVRSSTAGSCTRNISSMSSHPHLKTRWSVKLSLLLNVKCIKVWNNSCEETQGCCCQIIHYSILSVIKPKALYITFSSFHTCEQFSQ